MQNTIFFSTELLLMNDLKTKKNSLFLKNNLMTSRSKLSVVPPFLTPTNMSTIAQAEQLDVQDPLASFRAFFQHEPNTIYLDGNSLGKLPIQAKKDIANAVDKQWGENLIRSWNDHWLDLPKRLEQKLALLLGAKATELKVGESTSTNLYKVIHALLSSNLTAKSLLTDSLNFPSDVYVMEGLAKQFDLKTWQFKKEPRHKLKHMKLDILFEDNHLLIINKPIGVLVQGDKTGDIPLVDLAKAYIKQKYNKPGAVFLGVVHRLDRPTSGAIVFARTSKALERLNLQFKERLTKKVYWAITKETPNPPEDTLIHWTVRNQKQNKSYAHKKETPESKKSLVETTQSSLLQMPISKW